MFSRGQIYGIALDLVPINLIVTSLIAVKYQQEFGTPFFRFLGLAFLTGLLAEIIGVNFGWLFGSYRYGPVLGLSLWNTPLIIGLNWFLLAYCCGNLVSFLRIPGFVRWLASVLLLVGFDYFMEPVAVKNDFWSWTGGTIPVQNYTGWALVSSIIMAAFFWNGPPARNRVAAAVLVIQFLFFFIQNIF